MTDVLDSITSTESEAMIWAGATWVGQIEAGDVRGDRIRLIDGERFTRARILVRDDDKPRGFVELPIIDGMINGAELGARIQGLDPVAPRAPSRRFPPVSVAICTRDRPEHLRGVLEHLRQLVYPNFELIVVDNNPESGLTPSVVASFSDLPIRLVEAAGQGLSIARNVALKSAQHNIVAFTDDDVLVDPLWLNNLVYRFVVEERIACVCGMVPSAELVTPAQSYFDRRVGWARRCDPATYDLADPPEDDCLFPLRVAQFGTGANFAVRRDLVIHLGGFDEGLGIGSPTGGGEDIDLFVRVLLAGWRLAREPAAIVWHIHRRSAADLDVQIHNYGLGLGAWAAKLVSRPRTIGLVLQRLRPGIRHLRGITKIDQDDTIATEPELDGLDLREMQGVLKGPAALLKARVAGRIAKPLFTRSNRFVSALDFRREHMWGDPGNPIAEGRLAFAAVVFGLAGLVGLIGALPTYVLVPAVAAFALVGPGSLVLSWYTDLPAYALVPLMPIIGLGVCIIAVTGLLMMGLYNPILTLLGLTLAVVIGGLLRCAFLSRREAVSVV
jgi:glycosyltransferase involved in cell wall biosynthesis